MIDVDVYQLDLLMTYHDKADSRVIRLTFTYAQTRHGLVKICFLSPRVGYLLLFTRTLASWYVYMCTIQVRHTDIHLQCIDKHQQTTTEYVRIKKYHKNEFLKYKI